MKKIRILLGLLFLAVLLSGCGGPAPAAETPTPTPADEAILPLPTAAVQGELADAVRALMAPYEEGLAQAALQGGSIAYTIPGDLLLQWAQDAQALDQRPENGRYAFTWHAAMEASYVANADDAQAEMELLLQDATPDPSMEMPRDDQQLGDYSVAGGGLFDRTRTYDVAQSLTEGSAEITELLNGDMTGQELFSFAVRGDSLYFVDAALDVSANLDELSIREGYLVAVGVLRPDGLETVEYHESDPGRLPSPATLDWNRLLSSVTPLSRLSVSAAGGAADR